eukprot:TRINITY_DN9119_c0_g1_i2.p1 TRINITY_DN9119_c0_g1~~TRINITY_DN9119_c0_g1_i2.p1  ORF type:complete len:123 (-),score=33.41 TRINITY_DN9119_c0_g1_i2:37-405(-)
MLGDPDLEALRNSESFYDIIAQITHFLDLKETTPVEEPLVKETPTTDQVELTSTVVKNPEVSESTTTEEPVHVIEPISNDWSIQLLTLESMGFVEEKICIEFLEKHNGDIGGVIADLLSFST